MTPLMLFQTVARALPRARRAPSEVRRAETAIRQSVPATPAGRRLKVAYVMSRFPKLTETFVLDEMLAVERLGTTVELYPLLREREPIVHPDADELVGRANFLPMVSPEIVRSQLWFLRNRPLRYLLALLEVVRGTWGSANFLFGALGVFPKVVHAARLMEASGVEHVHCHFCNHPAVAGLVVHRLTGIPFSFTAHGSDLHVDRHMLPKKVEAAAFVATVSEYNRDLIVDECRGRFADKVHVVRCGVDTREFCATYRPSRDGGPLRLLSIGTLHEVKGQRVLVDACRLLRDEGVAFELCIIGDGPDRFALEAQIAEAGLADGVRLVGARSRPAVLERLRDSDVLVAPSVPVQNGKREGIPVVLMEAMSVGLPVVASRISGIPELVEHDVSGLLVPPGDARALADALRCLADPATRARLGWAGRARVTSEFDVRPNAERLTRLFTTAR